MTGKADYEKLQNKLDTLELPEIQMPAYQQRLRKTLLASSCFEKEITPSPFQHKVRARIYRFMPAAWPLVATLAVLLITLGTYATFFTAPQVVASLTLQVNPVINMTISSRNKVITANGLNADGQTLLARLDLTSQNVNEALRIIADALRKDGLLSPERRIIIALHPIGDSLGAADLAVLSGNVRRTIDEYLAGQEISLEVTSSELTAELMETAGDAGLLPADYVDLVAAVGVPLAWQVLSLYRELGLSPESFKEKLDDITEAIIELIEEKGLSEKEALLIIKNAIKADPMLKNFDGLLESGSDILDENMDERSDSERPRRGQTKPNVPNEHEAEEYESDKPTRDVPKPDAAGEEKIETEEGAEHSEYELQESIDDYQE
jgi:hypothetical protein